MTKSRGKYDEFFSAGIWLAETALAAGVAGFELPHPRTLGKHQPGLNVEMLDNGFLLPAERMDFRSKQSVSVVVSMPVFWPTSVSCGVFHICDLCSARNTIQAMLPLTNYH
jgi:hypothetical protein